GGGGGVRRFASESGRVCLVADLQRGPWQRHVDGIPPGSSSSSRPCHVRGPKQPSSIPRVKRSPLAVLFPPRNRGPEAKPRPPKRRLHGRGPNSTGPTNPTGRAHPNRFPSSSDSATQPAPPFIAAAAGHERPDQNGRTREPSEPSQKQKRLAFSRAPPSPSSARGEMCCCPSKACCICTLIVLVLVAVGLVFGFGIYTRGFHKITSNIHLEDGHPYGSFRAHGLFAPPPAY
ncbi:hypothetical protein BAE44_0001614, partial [Dichanthelium oligosanthes]